MDCGRIGKSQEELVYENSRNQFKADELFVRRIDGANIPILFPLLEQYLSYKPVFLKPPRNSVAHWYGEYTKSVVEPVFFNTKGYREHESTDLYFNQVDHEYRLMISKYLDYVVADNIQVPGYINIRNEKKIDGREFIKARRNVYGEPDCKRVY